ncbi:MAG: rhomboid family intramembrane serine protease [Candidatus Aenigmarchaeota archaeon]|nr:rhomboid family intramembrane serine protease [Candidatus Aenigmarchaeota archaeon]
MSKYPITIILAVVCTLIFLVQILVPSTTDTFVLQSADALARPWTLITAIFLHGSPSHLFSNLFALVMFGLILENFIGAKRLLSVFLAAGFTASIAATFFYDSTLGASGAIFGVMGALAVLRPRLVVWVLGVPMPMIVASVVWLLIDLLGVFFPTDVANMAHIAGLLIGIVIGLVLRSSYLQNPVQKFPPAVSEDVIDQWEDAYVKKKHDQRKE